MKHKESNSFTLTFPPTICLQKNAEILEIQGPLGKTSINLQKLDKKGMHSFSFCHESRELRVCMQSSSYKSLQTLLSNKIIGVSRGFLLYLRLHGSAFRVSKQNSQLIFKCGYSHDISYTIPNSVHIFVLEQTSVCVYGIEKNQVTQIAANLQKLRFPSVYKGKGIQFVNEVVPLKQGKRK